MNTTDRELVKAFYKLYPENSKQTYTDVIEWVANEEKALLAGFIDDQYEAEKELARLDNLPEPEFNREALITEFLDDLCDDTLSSLYVPRDAIRREIDRIVPS